MGVRSIIRAQLDLLWDPGSELFDVHAHTGADIDCTVRSVDETLGMDDALQRVSAGQASALP
jgi:hypothetical protein